MAGLHPFIRYYGGKWRAAPRYPKPIHDTIVEPFAGGAGYSLRYFERRVVLVEKYPVLAEMWRYLITAPPSEIRSIPCVDSVHDLPAWVPAGGRTLVGFAMNAATTRPCVNLSSGRRKLRASGGISEGWSSLHRERVSSQAEKIRHWRIIEGEYTSAPNAQATWFIDPPYQGKAGRHYVHNSLVYEECANWCLSRQGQVIVCEADGASWLPFSPFLSIKAMNTKEGARVHKESMFYIEHNDPGVGV